MHDSLCERHQTREAMNGGSRRADGKILWSTREAIRLVHFGTFSQAGNTVVSSFTSGT
jgi:hypothetical protein